MKYKNKIDGILFEKMLRNGLANLSIHEQEINDMNVFPVPDGDTGTNLRMTLENGLHFARSTNAMGAYLKALSEGMLLGARGNSGVILSQIFRGIFEELMHCGNVNSREMRNALIRGYEMAYKAVNRPVEGTILTVAREGIETIKNEIGRYTDFDVLLKSYVYEMYQSLERTPDLLPQLKAAGVLDSGAKGYILIFEGMCRLLDGEVLEGKEDAVLPAAFSSAHSVLFDENSAFDTGYCMEFILQRMNGGNYNQSFRLEKYIEELETMGESIVAVENGKKVKVHIHTRKPARIIMMSQDFGEFITFKLENMQIQHNEMKKSIDNADTNTSAGIMNSDSPSGEKNALQDLAVLAIVNGPGTAQIYREAGCHHLIQCGKTLSISVEEMIRAIDQIAADTVVILPNYQNNVITANAAAEYYRGKRSITVIPTDNCVSGYYALNLDIGEGHPKEMRIRQMTEAVQSIITISEAIAQRDSTVQEVKVQAGNPVAFSGGKILASGPDEMQTVFDAIEKADCMKEKESCILFRGSVVTKEEEQKLLSSIQERYPLLDVSLVNSGQSLYRWQIGLY